MTKKTNDKEIDLQYYVLHCLLTNNTTMKINHLLYMHNFFSSQKDEIIFLCVKKMVFFILILQSAASSVPRGGGSCFCMGVRWWGQALPSTGSVDVHTNCHAYGPYIILNCVLKEAFFIFNFFLLIFMYRVHHLCWQSRELNDRFTQNNLKWKQHLL